jgi:uncharacterized small protein (DUF1192 family)
MPDPLLPTDPAPPQDPPPSSTRRPKIVCECCECELTPTGDAIKLSDTFRGFRSLSEKIAVLKTELENAQTQLAKVTRERDEARSLAPKKSSLW